MTTQRFERQAELVPQDRLAGLTATVIGVGAIGRAVALQLAAIGVPRLQIVDCDQVEPTNVTTQGYGWTECGQLKVEALRNALQLQVPDVTIETIADRFRAHQPVGDVVFCGVDSISVRATIWRAVKDRCRFWADGRMLGEVLRVLTVAEEQGREHYPSTLFAQAEAQAGAAPPAARSTVPRSPPGCWSTSSRGGCGGCRWSRIRHSIYWPGNSPQRT